MAYMSKKAKKVLILSVAIIFIILGFFGLVLPFVIGVFLLSFYSLKARLWIEKHTKKYPRLFSITKKVEAWMAKIIGEI